MEHVKQHFKHNDPILYAAIQGEQWHNLTRTHDYFAGLCRIVIGQQVSTKAAASIYDKFCTLFPRKKPTVKSVLSLSEAQLRCAGLSSAKARSILDIAARVQNREINFKTLNTMNDEEVIAMLVKARGIGPWSAEMFLIFHLGREDVFSSGDYGLRMAIMKLYKTRTLPTPEDSNKLARKWAPYRSYACLILWKTLDNEPAPVP